MNTNQTPRQQREILFQLDKQDERSPYDLFYIGQPWAQQTVREQRNLLFDVNDQDEPSPYEMRMRTV